MTRWNLGPGLLLAAFAFVLVASACASPRGARVSFVPQSPAPSPPMSANRMQVDGVRTPTSSASASATPTRSPSRTVTASPTPSATPTSTQPPTATPAPATPTPTLPAPTATPQKTAAAQPAATSGGIYAVGDSVMLGAAASLTAEGIVVEAEESHSWDWGITVVQQWAAAGIHPSILIVHLGNNSGVSAGDFDAMMAAAGAAQVYFLTVYEPSLAAHQSQVNNALVAGVGRYANAHLIDWSSTAAGAVCSDGIHISCGGAATYVNLILASI